MYFESFPKLLHAYDDKNGNEILVLMRDITRNIRFRKQVLANITLYDEYDLTDGETAEIVAEKVYGSAQYHWIVMLLNDKYDYSTDFPLPTPQLVDYVSKKYGAGNEYDTHHYENSQGYIVSSDNLDAFSVSNFDYEDKLNEKKRTIKLISPELLPVVLASFEELM